MLWEKAAGVQEALVLADVEQLIAPMLIYPNRPDRGVYGGCRCLWPAVVPCGISPLRRD